MRENKEFFSFAVDSAHIKYGVWTLNNINLIWSHFVFLTLGKIKKRFWKKMASQSTLSDNVTILNAFHIELVLRSDQKGYCYPVLFDMRQSLHLTATWSNSLHRRCLSWGTAWERNSSADLYLAILVIFCLVLFGYCPLDPLCQKSGLTDCSAVSMTVVLAL